MATEVMSARTEMKGDKEGVLVMGMGSNTVNLLVTLQNLEANGHKVHYTEYSTAVPDFPIEIEPGRRHDVDTDEGRAEVAQLIGAEAISSLYISVPGDKHADLLGQHLPDVAAGRLNRLVTTKPVVETLDQLQEVEAALRLARAEAHARLGDAYDPKDPFIWVHEHYLTKAPWQALREQLNEICNRLGRLCSATVDIQEARTADDEGRNTVLAGGAFNDLAPHALSLGTDTQKIINSDPNGGYLIMDNKFTDVSFFRHEGSGLPAGKETSFVINGMTQVIDKTTAKAHDLTFTWCGGKGLVDKKQVILEFEHPDTSVRTKIKVDFIKNILAVPESVADLFPDELPKDDGYGESVAAGLNGGDPRESFQTFEDAAAVTRWGAKLTKKGRAKGAPTVHRKGLSLQEVAGIS